MRWSTRYMVEGSCSKRGEALSKDDRGLNAISSQLEPGSRLAKQHLSTVPYTVPAYLLPVTLVLCFHTFSHF